MRNFLFLIFFIAVLHQPSLGQTKQFLQISGEVGVEKAGAGDIRIYVIKITGAQPDTIKTSKVIPVPGDKVTKGTYILNLPLNGKFQIVFRGDTTFQDTKSIQVSTTLPPSEHREKFFLKAPHISIYMGRTDHKLIGQIFYNKESKEFKFMESPQ